MPLIQFSTSQAGDTYAAIQHYGIYVILMYENVTLNTNQTPTFVSVFHRILDLKRGWIFILAPFYFLQIKNPILLLGFDS